MKFLLREMQSTDIDQVVAIETEAFYPLNIGTSFTIQLRNKYSKYLVIERTDESLGRYNLSKQNVLFGIIKNLFRERCVKRTEIVGYVGIWFQGTEGHISEIAVKKNFRGNGLGELLLIGAIRTSISVGLQIMGLEVRASNIQAQRLYQKYYFQESGIRKEYYSNDREDAVIMTTGLIHSPDYQNKFIERQRQYLDSGKELNLSI
tara:strand:- start:21895 stop:22509 length:615 start_codon:yes stop_codon:yes gene_type:complete